tara:strand:- start:28 stop:309 length:282 start_codon:yes stop_codon:yes gene_type:complete
MQSAFTYIQAAFESMDKAMEQLTNAGAEMHGVMAEVHREQKIDLVLGETVPLRELQIELDTVIKGIEALRATKSCMQEAFDPNLEWDPYWEGL